VIESRQLKPQTMSWVVEPFDRKPFDIFFLKVGQQRYVGRKQPAVISYTNGIEKMKCCLVSPDMILGTAEREQITEGGITVFYRPLDAHAKESIFELVRKDPLTDLYYPYFPIGDPPEPDGAAEESYWTPTAERVQELDRGESMLRDYTLKWLVRFDMKKKLVYDPACSTGAFLQSIKEVFPDTHTVGQDLSREMVEYCRGRVDELYCGDSAFPPIKEESADFVFFRFLNVRVVNAVQAHEMFLENAKCCRIGGYLVLFGHTPVILSSEWFEELGLKVEQRTGFSDTLNSVFQYYVLRKITSLPVTPLVPNQNDHLVRLEGGSLV
jgi:isonocardicin synthase